jgi:hypothetical protein
MKIFRNIRQKLAAENKVAAYLRYAIGEIFLVVIGILIALQVNNWKEDIQNHKLEKTTLENIRSDLVLQQGIINEQLQFESAKVAETDTAALFLSDSLSAGKLNALLITLSTRLTFVENKTSYISMDNTGGKKLIRNSSLKNAIVRYYQRLDYVTQVINNDNLFNTDSEFGAFVTSNSLNIKLNRNGQIDKDQKISPEKRMELKNQLVTRKLVSQNIYKLCRDLQEKTKHLIQLIDKELH